MISIYRTALAALISSATFLAGVTQAGTLTATAINQGFGLSTFLDQVPATGFCCGPLGIVNTPSGILVSSYVGDLRSFTNVDGHHWSDSPTAPGAAYGGARPAGLTSLAGRYYLTQQATGRVVEVSANGAFIQNIVNIGNATGIVANPANGLLYVSTGAQILAVDPIAKTFAVFNAANADGLTISGDGKTLYAEASGRIFGYDTTSKAQVFDSGPISGGPDGTVFGAGALSGNLFVNTNGGTLIEIDIATLAQTLLFTGGTRGDFVSVDTATGTLLFTQSDTVLRLTAPQGGCFGDECVNNTVPLPSTVLLLLMGIAGLGALKTRSSSAS
jgi:hypothetical protein